MRVSRAIRTFTSKRQRAAHKVLKESLLVPHNTLLLVCFCVGEALDLTGLTAENTVEAVGRKELVRSVLMTIKSTKTRRCLLGADLVAAAKGEESSVRLSDAEAANAWETTYPPFSRVWHCAQL